MSSALKNLCPGEPPLTEENLGTQEGKVFVVTGANTGLGKELCKILYSKNAKVYVAARSERKAKEAIEEIRGLHPTSKGALAYLHLDLSDLTTIKKSADDFLARESRLDTLWNNAGVMVPPQGSKTAQGHELQLGVNNIGTFLFTRFLYPLMIATARSTSPPANSSVRVVWVSSDAAQGAPKPAIDFDNMDYKHDEGAWQKYQRSKAGTIITACEAARRSVRDGDGVLHVSLHPGVFPTDLQRTMPGWQARLVKTLGKEPKYGAYTQLFAGLHPSVQNGVFVSPYGRLDQARKDFYDESLGRQYWDWMDKQIGPYV
ncbi:putative short-chain dehydrogenase [Rosellinia necatrix]|uniref:Putative short-chain dehydrogenase n=1 Tax=Rosellinia necatrix TaxID=77044 RepID=A0A1W2TJA3_ROSNE|nr:putative short-chain dehydrogenase [Rosellinia necatrix]